MMETTWKSLGLDHLPMTDKIHIVKNLLDDLDADEPILASHLEELQRRIAESKANPHEGSSWNEVLAEIEKEL